MRMNDLQPQAKLWMDLKHNVKQLDTVEYTLYDSVAYNSKYENRHS